MIGKLYLLYIRLVLGQFTGRIRFYQEYRTYAGSLFWLGARGAQTARILRFVGYCQYNTRVGPCGARSMR